MRGIKRRYLISLACLFLVIQGKAGADDTEIFGGGTINIPPNVLIIFDNSGSMGENILVQLNAYDKGTEYTGSYSRGKVYRKSGSQWVEFTSIGTNYTVDSSEIYCDGARTDLNDKGFWSGRLRNSGPYACGANNNNWYNLRSGNYCNWASTNLVYRKKIVVAKDTITDLLRTHHESVRFGVMIFNDDTEKAIVYSEGGKVIVPLKMRNDAEIESVCTTINGINPITWTPLAETLAEAGLYFAGAESYFNSGVNYATAFSEKAIQWRCQKNYIIYMTDGEPTGDRNSLLTTTGAYLGKTIGDYDGDIPSRHANEHKDGSGMEYTQYGSDYLDDVAKFLHNEDLITDAGLSDFGGVSFNDDGGDYAKQFVTTYTIGFDIDHPLLSRAADAEHGGGDYYTTSQDITLAEIFSSIMGKIKETNSEYVAPVVPINRVNRTYAANGLYLSIFSPDHANPGTWKGNLKKFGLDSSGVVLDRDGNQATDSSGSVMSSAHSAWVSVSGNEGMGINLGGAGGHLLTQTYRQFKTFKETIGMMDLSTGNTNLVPGDLGLSTEAQKNDLIQYVTATGNYSPSSASPLARTWVLGDILHSQPAILYDSPNKRNVIFVGANDGFMHCFVDSDKGTNSLTDDEVTESWAFTPWELLLNLKYLPPVGGTTEISGDANHDYFVDGSPTVYRSGDNTYLAFGLRRGGKNISSGYELGKQYFILNISNYASPTYAGGISRDILTNEKLGQSWSTPYFCKIRTGATSTEDVLLLTGGYDTNQDNANPGANDLKGRAVFAVNARTGSLANTNFNTFNRFEYDKMNYCIVDFRSYDDNDDGYDDVVYAPSVGGELFAFESRVEADGTYDGVWSKRLLFKADKQDGSTAKLRKFFCAPGIAQEIGFDYLYVGSGDREHPIEVNVTNRFYAIKNSWSASWDDTNPITDTNLTNLTDDVLQGTVGSPSSLSEEAKTAYRSSLYSSPGWYFNLEHTGEKVVSTPLVYNKVVYFTTFTPTISTSTTEDKCHSAGSGIARLYAVNYKTGESVFSDFDDNPGELTKEDRSKEIGSGIPSDPMLVVTEKGTFVLVGRDTGPDITKTNEKESMHRYYWHKVH